MCEAHLLEPLLPFLSTVYKNLTFPIYLLQFLYNLAKHERYTCINDVNSGLRVGLLFTPINSSNYNMIFIYLYDSIP